MSDDFVKWNTRTATALCRHYTSAHFDEQRVQVVGVSGASTGLRVSWAVGMLADGDWEALGAWAGAAAGAAFWRGVWEELNARGVHKISLVCAADRDAGALCPAVKVLVPWRRILGQEWGPAASGVGVLRAQARCAVREASGVRAARIALERLLAKAEAGGAGVLAPDWPGVLEGYRAFYALGPERRALVRAGDETLEQLGHSLHRAVVRHGPFAEPAAAVLFVARTLCRDAQRLKLCALSAARPAMRVVDPDLAGLASPRR